MAVQVLCSVSSFSRVTCNNLVLYYFQAYRIGKFYPNYAWILLGHHETDWWREHYMETNCSDTDMLKVLNRSLVFIPYPDIGNFNNFKKMVTTIYIIATQLCC